MAETWITCPLFRKYRETKRTYIKELRLEKWKEEQRIELWNAIRITFADIQEPKKEYWAQRLYSYYCRRFVLMSKVDWLVFLGELSDEQAYGNYKHLKAKEYCCLVRNTAYWMTHQADDRMEKVCEPADYFEYFGLAA